MAGSTYGTLFKISTWGESHGKALGVVIDGCPAGIPLCEDDIQPFMDRRKPGQSVLTTSRKEADQVEILSGVFEGKTTGTPISLVLYNTSQRSGDYSNISEVYRPGHADYTFDEKYGFRDYRGGGRSSGRETAGRVAAGAVASKMLAMLGISIQAYTRSIGPIEIDPSRFDPTLLSASITGMPDAVAAKEAEAYMQEARANLDSVGGCIECRVNGLPVGLGEPVFEKLDANLAKAMLSIGAVKAFEVGDGIKASLSKGSENNDAFFADASKKVTKQTNHSGGVLGGMTDGSELVLRAYFKPTPSIAQTQNTVDMNHNNVTIQIEGRHDPIIVPRAIVVVEAMTALTLADAVLINMSSRIDRIADFYHSLES